MNIIEKLGITKAPWRTWNLGVNEFVQDSECINLCEIMSDNWQDAQLIASAPDMLEALIWQCKYFESLKSWGNFDSKYYAFLQRQVPVIEKATGKTWKEIKDLL